MVSVIVKVRPLAQRAHPKSGPEGTTLHALLQARNIDMLFERAILEPLRKVITLSVVDVVFIMCSNEEHQIIMTICRALAYVSSNVYKVPYL